MSSSVRSVARSVPRPSLRRRPSQHGVRGRVSAAALTDGVAVVLLVLVAMTVLDGTFDGPWFLVSALTGALGGVAAAALIHWLRAPMVALALPVVVLGFVLGPPAALRSTAAGGLPGPTGLAEMWNALVGGWKELLTTLPPVSSTGRLTTIPFLLSLAGAAIGFLLARRWRHPHLPIIGPAIALVGAIVLGLSAPGGIAPRALGFLVLAVAWGAERRRRLVVATGGGRGRRIAVGAALLAVAATVGIVAAPAVIGPASARAVLRDTVLPPLDLSDQPSPLADFRRFRPTADDLADEVLLRTSGLPQGTLVRLATVDAYAGTVWAAGQAGTIETTGVGADPGDTAVASQGRFLRVGSRIPVPRPGPSVSGTVTIAAAYADNPDLRIWVPSVGEPTGLKFTGDHAAALGEDLRFNPITDSALVLGGLRAGDSYTIDALLPEQATPDSAGPVGPPTAPSAYTGVVARFVTSTPGSSGNAVAALKAVAERLRTEGAYTDGGEKGSTESVFVPGHSLGRLAHFLGDSEPAGNDEQYAAALALAADYLGLPGRVTLAAVPDAGGTIHGSDVRAYVEVQVRPDRWWTIAPDRFIPDRDKHPQERQRTEENRAESAVVPPPNEQRPPSSLEGFALDTTSSSRNRSLIDNLGWTLPAWAVLALKVAGVPVGAILLWTLVLVLGKSLRRRRRRRRGTPGARVAAAWDEVVDVLRDAGIPVAVRHTRPELAAAVAQPSVAEVAALADRLTFGPMPVDDDEAAQAWTLVRRVRGQVAADQRWRDRWRSAVSLRSVLPDRVSTIEPVRPSQVHRGRVRAAVIEPEPEGL